MMPARLSRRSVPSGTEPPPARGPRPAAASVRLLLLILVGVVGLAAADGDEHLRFLRNDRIEVGILPQAAGRVVVLRHPGGINALASEPAAWADVPEPAYKVYAGIGGHMTWVGPQSRWWAQQDLTDQFWPSWPPDPWLTLARATVEGDEDHLVATVPASPISGIDLRKTYRLDGNRIHLRTVGTNRSDRVVSWGLWSNLHPRPAWDAFVLLGDKGRIELRSTSTAKIPTAALPQEYLGDVLALPAEGPIPYQGKLYLNDTVPALCAIGDGLGLMITTAGVPTSEIAPDQARLEIYRKRDAGGPFLELEHHGAYRDLQPGDEIVLEETWILNAYDGGPALADRAAWARAQIEASLPPSR